MPVVFLYFSLDNYRGSSSWEAMVFERLGWEGGGRDGGGGGGGVGQSVSTD